MPTSITGRDIWATGPGLLLRCHRSGRHGHGRPQPPAGRRLRRRFCAALPAAESQDSDEVGARGWTATPNSRSIDVTANIGPVKRQRRVRRVQARSAAPQRVFSWYGGVRTNRDAHATLGTPMRGSRLSVSPNGAARMSGMRTAGATVSGLPTMLSSAREPRFASVSGSEVSWLPPRFRRRSAMRSPRLSGTAVRQLLLRSSSFSALSRPSARGE
jgi:hypothetical protein